MNWLALPHQSKRSTRPPWGTSPLPWSPLRLQDRGRAEALYREVQDSVEEGIRYLLAARERDPYNELLPRSLWESLHPGQQAPTFPL